MSREIRSCYVWTQCLVLIFLLTAIIVPLFRTKGSSPYTCLTFWGQTTKCYRVTYDSTGVSAFGCEGRRDIMQRGAACAILGILSVIVAIVLGRMMVVKVRCPLFVPLIFFHVLSVIFIFVSLVCVRVVMKKEMCGYITTFGDPSDPIGEIETLPTKYADAYDYFDGYEYLVYALLFELLSLIVIRCMWKAEGKEEEGKEGEDKDDEQPFDEHLGQSVSDMPTKEVDMVPE